MRTSIISAILCLLLYAMVSVTSDSELRYLKDSPRLYLYGGTAASSNAPVPTWTRFNPFSMMHTVFNRPHPGTYNKIHHYQVPYNMEYNPEAYPNQFSGGQFLQNKVYVSEFKTLICSASKSYRTACNTCMCGGKACTKRMCPPQGECMVGTIFKMADDCNICYCVAKEKDQALCSNIDCDFEKKKQQMQMMNLFHSNNKDEEDSSEYY